MLTEKQLNIFEVFAKSPFAEFTRKEIKDAANQNSNNALALAINKLKKEEVVIEKTIGRSGILTLNQENDLTFHYIALCNMRRISTQVKHSLEILRKEISEE